MREKIICPFLKEECQEDSCGLWSEPSEQCALLKIAETFGDLTAYNSMPNQRDSILVEVKR